MSARILVAEDSLEIASFISDYLTMQGHQVDVVSDGLELMKKAEELHPQLIVTDIQMPGAFGSTAYTVLRKNESTKDIPIIFVSGHPVESMMPKDPKIRFLDKPIDLKKFERLLNELLSSDGPRP